MYKKIFFDANIILDIFDLSRPSAKESFEVYTNLIFNKTTLYTSCDIITTLFYVHSKKNRLEARQKIEKINRLLKVIDFSNKEITQTCQLMSENAHFKDLEDTIQYILAKKEGCELIISNDKGFYSEEIPVLSSKEFVDTIYKRV